MRLVHVAMLKGGIHQALVDLGVRHGDICYEGTQASARAWLEVASAGYLDWRASI